jgi:ABC-2 type transport system ATP-binding protein
LGATLFVETHALTKQYREVTALDGCSLGVQRGEIFGLLGPNGAGKTTLLRLLLGYLRPTGGAARIDTLDCARQSVLVRSRVSYLPGEARLFRRMRGREVLKFFSRVRAGVDLNRSLEIAERLGLELSRPVVHMSTGMRQKLALSVTLSPNVPLIILDEPTSSLDPTMRSEVLELVREVQAEGRTVVFSSHVLSEVEAVCDRVAILRQGRLVHTQTMSDLRTQHRIAAQLNGPMPPLPSEFGDSVQVVQLGEGRIVLETPGALPPMLSWLAQLPVAEMRIEPVGLQAIYDRYQRAESP